MSGWYDKVIELYLFGTPAWPWTFFLLRTIGTIWCICLLYSLLMAIWRHFIRGSYLHFSFSSACIVARHQTAMQHDSIISNFLQCTIQVITTRTNEQPVLQKQSRGAEGYDLLARYGGKGTWAIVTGATDGIGLAYAKELTRLGFNLLLVSRNATKLEARKKEVLQTAQAGVEIQTVELDFNIPYSDAAYAPLIQALENKDLGLLVNNVGVMTAHDFHTFPYDQLLEILNINIEATTFVTRLTVPKMVALKHRCGVVTISSILAEAPIPYAGVYAATKAYCTYFSNALALEYRGSNLDFLNCPTGPVETKSNNRDVSFFHLQPEEAVRAQLKCLGRDTETHGHLKHSFISILYRWLPNRDFIGKKMKATFEPHQPVSSHSPEHKKED